MLANLPSANLSVNTLHFMLYSSFDSTHNADTDADRMSHCNIPDLWDTTFQKGWGGDVIILSMNDCPITHAKGQPLPQLRLMSPQVLLTSNVSNGAALEALMCYEMPPARSFLDKIKKGKENKKKQLCNSFMLKH